MILELPWPPSINEYWKWGVIRSRRRAPRRGVYVSANARRFHQEVALLALAARRGEPPLEGKLSVEVSFYPPDRQRRDCDNPIKALLDALAHACVYADDAQVKRLLVLMKEARPPSGLAVVRIEHLKEG